MSYCTKCGASLNDGDVFCRNCGNMVKNIAGANQNAVPATPVQPAVSNTIPNVSYNQGSNALTEEEQNIINRIASNLRRERIAYIICSAVGMSIMIFYFIFLRGVFNLFFSNYYTPFGVFGYLMGLYTIVLGILILPVFIVGFAAAGRIGFYTSRIRTNVAPARKRCGSVGMIIFSALFNNIAMIFVIINFIYVKRNAKKLDEIEYKQMQSHIPY